MSLEFRREEAESATEGEEEIPMHNLIAIDLGASSGRAVLGRLAAGRLSVTEVYRFENVPVSEGDSLRWDLDALERTIRHGIKLAREAARGEPIHGIGVDSWGVDYVLLDGAGKPVDRPFHYRDRRTDGVLESVCGRLGREEIFERTGIQFMGINTIYQLAAEDPERLARAECLLMMADFFTHRLGGRAAGEVTLASTSQLVNPRTRTWDFELAGKLGLAESPARLLPELVEAGTASGDFEGVPVFATAAHDTAAAVAGCPGSGENWVFLSSGTWSLLGVETPSPVVTEAALDANLSNELGICGTTRLLKNICGLWPLQECRREWAEAGKEYSWEKLSALAEKAQPLSVIIDPDDGRFLAPESMLQAIADFCGETGQATPKDEGQMVRLILDGLALKCRWVLALLEKATGTSIDTINMIGGGVQNRLLCRLTADACGRRVVAGPVEATAAGNLLTQAMGAGAVASQQEARSIVARSFDLTEYEPHTSSRWDEAHGRLEEMLKG